MTIFLGQDGVEVLWRKIAPSFFMRDRDRSMIARNLRFCAER
jgi:hypothetical protein